jgi:hypothetical protein
LYEYIVHRIYDYDFYHRPNIIDRDAYFIPAGYDSLQVLNSFDIQGDLQKIYNERISNIEEKGNTLEKEIVCEDAQVFLKKFYGQSSSKNTQSTTKSHHLMDKENHEKSKVSLNNYGTATKEDIKQLTKDISTNKIKNMYNTNTKESHHIDGADKEQFLNKIKNQELEKLMNNKSSDHKETKGSATEMLKKRLDALKNNKK